MGNFLKRIFAPDWKVVDVFYGDKYKITDRFDRDRGHEQNIFMIYYSEPRKEYKLDYFNCNNISDDSAYHQALNKLSNYNKELLNKTI